MTLFVPRPGDYRVGQRRELSTCLFPETFKLPRAGGFVLALSRGLSDFAHPEAFSKFPPRGTFEMFAHSETFENLARERKILDSRILHAGTGIECLSRLTF